MNLTQKALQKLGIEVEDKGWERRAYAKQCPFHTEKTGSWFIRLRGERAGLHHCFGCKASGDLVDLVERKLGYSRTGAKEWLEQLRRGEVVEDDARPKVEGVRLVVSSLGRRAFLLPREVHFGPLADWVTPARDYAVGRHLTPEQVARWGIGYAVAGRLSGRLVLPVRDVSGEARSYMARTFADHEARYFYPREREGADLDCVFGEQHWSGPHTRPDGTVVVCEGALNALAVERALDPTQMVFQRTYVAALGGSDVRPMHVGKISRFGRVVVLVDDDAAGDGAAEVLYAQLARHTRVARASLGRGRDADNVTPSELRDLLCGTIAST